MKSEFTDEGRQDFLALEKQLQVFFKKHIEKLLQMPPRRHLKFGVPHNVEDVTRQARMVYNIENETLFVVKCFATHNEYEKWYAQFK